MKEKAVRQRGPWLYISATGSQHKEVLFQIPKRRFILVSELKRFEFDSSGSSQRRYAIPAVPVGLLTSWSTFSLFRESDSIGLTLFEDVPFL